MKLKKSQKKCMERIVNHAGKMDTRRLKRLLRTLAEGNAIDGRSDLAARGYKVARLLAAS